MLLLLSSSARRRYSDDIVRALAHPAGTELRFRYGTEYIEETVLAKVRKRELVGQPALICHLADQADGKPASVIPCRFTTIARTQLVGTSVILNLSAGDYIQNLDDNKLRDLMSDAEKALLPNQGTDAERPPGKFAFEIASPLTAFGAPVSAAVSAFEQTAKALRSAGFGAAGPAMAFYAVRDLVEIKGVLGQPDTVIQATRGSYALRSGQRYALDVYSYAPEGDTHPSDASTLIVSADDSDVKFSSEKAAKLDSRYDLNRFRFSMEQRLLALPTGMRVSLGVPTGVDGKTVEERCDITLELRFDGSFTFAAVRVALIAAGTAAPAIIGAYAAQKGSIGLSAVMFIAAVATGVGTIFPSLKKS